uniref:BTB domain-containing protein n=1 Tax=Panagrolaimus sp. ES5 TaxID=591445 RepID=A0AC34GEK3_9BILA
MNKNSTAKKRQKACDKNKEAENVAAKKIKTETTNESSTKKTGAAKSEPRSANTEIIRAIVENSVTSNSHDSASVVTKAIVAPASETPIPTNAKDSKWSEILSDKRYADVILVCRYNVYKIPTYRCLLAKYSNVFEEIFKKSNELPVKINTGFDATTIKAALAFMLDKSYPAGN